MYYPNWDTEYDNSGLTPEPTPTDTLWREDSNILKPINSNAIVQMNRFGTNANKVISNIITSTDKSGILSDNQLMTAAKIQSLVNNTNTSPFEYVEDNTPTNVTHTTITGIVKYTDKIPQENDNNTLFSVGPIHCSDVIQIEDSKIGPPITEYWNTENGLYTKHVTTDNIQTQNIGVNGDTITTTLTLPSYDTINTVTIGDIQTMPSESGSENKVSIPSTNYVKNEISEAITNNALFVNNSSNVDLKNGLKMNITSDANIKTVTSDNIATKNINSTTCNFTATLSNGIGCKSLLVSDSLGSPNYTKSINLDPSANTMINVISPNGVYQSLGSDVNNKTTIGYDPQNKYGLIQSSFYDGTTQNISNVIFKSDSITLNKNTIIPSLTLNNVSINTVQTSTNTDTSNDNSIPTTKKVENMINDSQGLQAGTILRSTQKLSNMTFRNCYFSWIEPISSNESHDLSVSWSNQPDGIHILIYTTTVGNTYVKTFLEAFHGSDYFNILKLINFLNAQSRMRCISGGVCVYNSTTLELMQETQYYNIQLRFEFDTQNVYGQNTTLTALPSGFNGFHTFEIVIQSDMIFNEDFYESFKQTYPSVDIQLEYENNVFSVLG